MKDVTACWLPQKTNVAPGKGNRSVDKYVLFVAVIWRDECQRCVATSVNGMAIPIGRVSLFGPYRSTTPEASERDGTYDVVVICRLTIRQQSACCQNYTSFTENGNDTVSRNDPVSVIGLTSLA